MNSPTSPEVLVANPNAFMVRVGATVTCRYSGRKVVVAKRGAHGEVWDRMEPNHPAITSFPADHLRYFGTSYLEFEPAFISQAELDALFTRTSTPA
jgi:hypothetical protein